eukprot:7100972-Prymnesium_polylepis.1
MPGGMLEMPISSNQLSAMNPTQNAPAMAKHAHMLCHRTLPHDVPQCLKQAAPASPPCVAVLSARSMPSSMRCCAFSFLTDLS